MTWFPHVTVAAIVHQNEKFLMVEEYDKASGNLVINQPAGHLEEDESITDALIRETYEETGWNVKPTSVLGIHLYKAANKVTYLRINFLAEAIEQDPNAILDADIHRAIWMSEQEITEKKSMLRSELVSQAITLYHSNARYPLSILHSLLTAT